MKRRLFLTLSAGMLGSAGVPSIATAGKMKLKLANVNGASSHLSLYGYDKFAELVGEKTNDEVEVHHFPGGQLGSDKETFEAAQLGMLEFASGSFANLTTLTRAFEVLHLPYIFDHREQAHRVIDSEEFRNAINEQLHAIGLHWFLTFDYGFRKIGTATKRVVSPDDMVGLKMRASRSPTEIGALEAFGASAVTIDWPEVYNALRLGIVDGEAVPPNEFYSSKHHEVVRYITNNDFQYLASISVISLKKWEGFSEDLRQALQESAAEAQAYHRSKWVTHTASSIAEMEDAGVEFIDVPDDAMAAWKEKARSVWKESGVDDAMIELVRSMATS